MSHPGNIPVGARVVAWSDVGFSFPHPCDILVDAGIFLALFDLNDAWYPLVHQLWVGHVVTPAIIPGLWINNYVVGEYLNRALKKAQLAGALDNVQTRRAVIDPLFRLLGAGTVRPLEGTADSLVTGLAMFETGADAGDAFHIAEMNSWGIDFLTVDFRLARRLRSEQTLSGRTIYVPQPLRRHP